MIPKTSWHDNEMVMWLLMQLCWHLTKFTYLFLILSIACDSINYAIKSKKFFERNFDFYFFIHITKYDDSTALCYLILFYITLLFNMFDTDRKCLENCWIIFLKITVLELKENHIHQLGNITYTTLQGIP